MTDKSQGSQKKNLAIKMLGIMKEVEYIQKTGFNSFHKYKYATESDITSSFSKAMLNNNVFMFTSIIERNCEAYKTRGNKEAFLITVKLEITFIDADSGESYTGTFFGDGSDSDDKGIYKAITGAQKYALMKTFLVETGDDPEREERLPEKNNTELVSTLVASARQGSEAFRAAWRQLDINEKAAVKDQTQNFKEICLEADKSLEKPE